jgi:hypothetical protein
MTSGRATGYTVIGYWKGAGIFPAPGLMVPWERGS